MWEELAALRPVTYVNAADPLPPLEVCFPSAKSARDGFGTLPFIRTLEPGQKRGQQ